MRKQLDYFACISTTVLKKDVLILEEGRKKKGCQSEQVIVFILCFKRRLTWFGK